MKRILIALSAVLVAIIILSGVNGMRPHHIASHTFDVPKEYRRDEGVFWVPEAQDVLKFALNPRSSPVDQILVSVEGYVDRCSAQAGSASAVCDALDIGAYKNLNPLNKVLDKDDQVTWAYQINQGGQWHTIASCFSSMTEDERGGFCSSRIRYSDLLISIRYRENNVSNLARIVDDIGRKLSEWDS